MKDRLNAIAKMHEETEQKRQAELLKRSRKKAVKDMEEDVEGRVREDVEKKAGEKDCD